MPLNGELVPCFRNVQLRVSASALVISVSHPSFLFPSQLPASFPTAAPPPHNMDGVERLVQQKVVQLLQEKAANFGMAPPPNLEIGSIILLNMYTKCGCRLTTHPLPPLFHRHGNLCGKYPHGSDSTPEIYPRRKVSLPSTLSPPISGVTF